MGISGKVFEYFFDAEELEPYYSELKSSAPFRGQRPKSAEDQKQRTPLHKRASESPRTPPVAASIPVQSTVASRCEDNGDTAVEQNAVDIVEETTPESEPEQRTPASSGKSVAEDEPRSRVRRFLSVHALGQYLYCPRSAILAAERGDDEDIDEPLPRLTYLPNFDRERIEVILKKKLGEIGFSIALGFCAGCFLIVGALEQNRPLFFISFFTIIAALMWSLRLSVGVVRLAARRRAAIVAEAREPDPEVLGIQAVNWWSMLKAGFEPVNYDRPFRHPEFPLEGCPWRVLERDSIRIPVIRSGGDRLGVEKGKLYPKHQIRLVAYALLLEAAGHIDVPYGLVFPTDSPHGLAFEITDELRSETVQTLKEFSIKLSESQEHQIEPRLPQPKRCEHCRHGFPELIQINEINRQRKQGNRVVVLMNGRGKTFHCTCSDRFGSAPPHGKSLELGLVASIR